MPSLTTLTILFLMAVIIYQSIQLKKLEEKTLEAFRILCKKVDSERR